MECFMRGIASTHIGNVMMGDHNKNIHAINELGIPVFCDGLKDVIVAVAPDGIMVCDKQDSEKKRTMPINSPHVLCMRYVVGELIEYRTMPNTKTELAH